MSEIQWTDETWNPLTGCTKVSAGCANCYIERTPAMRMKRRKFVGGRIPLEFHEDRLDKPLRLLSNSRSGRPAGVRCTRSLFSKRPVSTDFYPSRGAS